MHGDKYLYNRVWIDPADKKYWHSTIIVVCPEHGAFKPTPASHYYGATGCIHCGRVRVGVKSRQRSVIKHGSFVETHPDIAKEWDTERNKPYAASEFSYGADHPAYWICPNGHSYLAKIYHRTGSNSGCPTCGGQSSQAELRLLSELQELFDDVRHRYKIDGMEVDAFVPEYRLAFEYDGVFYHRPRLIQDIKKNVRISATGATLWRVREGGLFQTSSRDIQCAADFLQKSDLDNLVRNILKTVHAPSDELLQRINAYLACPDFVAEDRYKSYLAALPLGPQESSILETHPDCADIWNHEKNKPLRPQNFTYGSNTKVWWICGLGHEYFYPINTKLKLNGVVVECAKCGGWEASESYNLATECPEAAELFDLEKNECKPEEIMPRSEKVVWWRCKKQGHSFDMAPDRIVRAFRKGKHKCPICIGSRVTDENCLATVYPESLKLWDHSKNVESPEKIYCHSPKRYYWRCEKGHFFKDSPKHLAKRKEKCSYCAGLLASESYSLESEFPNIAQHFLEKENGMRADQELPKSNQTRWWKCFKGHIYKKATNKRVALKVDYCTVCESLPYLEPEVTKQWDWGKNRSLDPANFKPSSTIEVWWLCPKGHSLKEKILSRVKKKHCDICERKIPSDEYNLATERPELIQFWDFTANGENAPSNYLPNSGKAVWWRCKNGHNYEYKIQGMFQLKGDISMCRPCAGNSKPRKSKAL